MSMFKKRLIVAAVFFAVLLTFSVGSAFNPFCASYAGVRITFGRDGKIVKVDLPHRGDDPSVCPN